MAKGGFPGFGGGGMNMGNLMKQAKKMQDDMARVQKELEEKEVNATSGGGAIKVTVTGKKMIKSIEISPEVVDADDVEMLQDLIIAAINEAMRMADDLASSDMNSVTGGMGGLF